jgi:hypothetical protein
MFFSADAGDIFEKTPNVQNTDFGGSVTGFTIYRSLYDFTLGQIYTVSLAVSASIFVSPGDAAASTDGYLDPTLQIDSSQVDQSLYTLTLSPGLSNVATPLPTALPLFATALGGLGLLGWRRKRKTQPRPMRRYARSTSNGFPLRSFSKSNAPENPYIGAAGWS